MGYFRRLQVSTRIPPARSSGADVGGSAAGVCRGETTHVAITKVAAVVVCASVKKSSPKEDWCMGSPLSVAWLMRG